MSIKDFLKEKLKGMSKDKSFGVVSSDVPPTHQYGDRITQDKRILSLRRLRNRQMDIVENERLTRDINSFERHKASKDFLGTSMLGGKINRKRKPTVKSKSIGFLGMGRM